MAPNVPSMAARPFWSSHVSARLRAVTSCARRRFGATSLDARRGTALPPTRVADLASTRAEETPRTTRAEETPGTPRARLDLRREGVAARDGADGAVVAARQVLGAARVLARGHGGRLRDEGERDDLEEAEAGDVVQRIEAVADVRELDRAVEGHGAREGDVELLHHHAEERHHGDAAVLDLDRAAARERLLLLPEEACFFVCVVFFGRPSFGGAGRRSPSLDARRGPAARLDARRRRAFSLLLFSSLLIGNETIGRRA